MLKKNIFPENILLKICQRYIYILRYKLEIRKMKHAKISYQYLMHFDLLTFRNISRALKSDIKKHGNNFYRLERFLVKNSLKYLYHTLFESIFPTMYIIAPSESY